MTASVHVVGAGVAGLSAATRLAEAGRRVRVYDAAPQAGGRCRSFHDGALGAVIDNGNHLMLNGNRALGRYLERIGARQRVAMRDRARFPFIDLATGRGWTVDLGAGKWPMPPFSERARVPGTSIIEYFNIFRLLNVDINATVENILGASGRLYERFWRPVSLAVLNTPVDEAAARLMSPVVREIVLRGGDACRPMIARHGLSDALIDPALAYLQRRAGPVAFGARLRAVDRSADGRRVLRFSGDDVEIGPDDVVILAVPAWAAADLIDGLRVPDRHEPIVNAHFRLERAAELDAGQLTLTGVLGGAAEWFLIRDEIVSVTVSAARDLVERPAEAIADVLWADIARALDLPAANMPPHTVIKERRATFSQTPAQCALRPDTDAAGEGVLLAGDWTATGLPATIEGAICSGEAAAEAAIAYAR